MAYNKRYRTKFSKKSEPQEKLPRVHRKWSDYQKAIFDEVAFGTGNVQVDSLAGSGKTSSIVESFYHLPQGKTALMVAFNKSTQLELDRRAPESVLVSTLHSLGFKACLKSFPRMSRQVAQDKAEGYIKAAVGDEREDFDLRTNLKQMVSLCKAYLAEKPEEMDEIMDRHGIDSVDRSREEFIGITIGVLNACKRDTSKVDFDDMVWLPVVHNLHLNKYDVVFCDESQDLNKCQIELALRCIDPNGRIISVGDVNQCVSNDTMVRIIPANSEAQELLKEDNRVVIEEVQVGDKILSYRNGKNVYQTVTKVVPSNETEGIKVTTKSGKSITMTYRHQLWASLPKLSDEQTIVYLMYREGYGYRVGITNKGYDSTGDNNISSRLNQESASKLWILDVCNSREDAHLKEIAYSLHYGIPTTVFNWKGRYLSQNHVESLFSMFGMNGLKLLIDKCLDVSKPHWITYSKVGKSVISFVEHGNKGSQVTLEWTEKESEFINILNEHDISFTSAKNNGRYRIRKWFMNNREAFMFAHKLGAILALPISRKLSCKQERVIYTTAASLHTGMSLPVMADNGFVLDEIVSIEKVEDYFLDIEVEDSSNFYGEDILTHNCIYSFRGADSNAIQNIVDRCNSKRMPLSITYRCAKAIVKCAQEYVPELEAASDAAEGLVETISDSKMEEMVQKGDFVLSRTNAPLIRWCLNFLKAGIPANIQGRDLARNLMAMVRKSKANSVIEFLQWVDEWCAEECARLEERDRDTSIVKDKAECLEVICEGCKSLDDVMFQIDKLFHDGDDYQRVILSTTHKAKGLERDRVFLLRNTYNPGRSKEEINLMYVAITRSKKELYLVD